MTRLTNSFQRDDDAKAKNAAFSLVGERAALQYSILHSITTYREWKMVMNH